MDTTCFLLLEGWQVSIQIALEERPMSAARQQEAGVLKPQWEYDEKKCDKKYENICVYIFIYLFIYLFIYICIRMYSMGI